MVPVPQTIPTRVSKCEGLGRALCSRARRRIGGVGEGFADGNVETVYPCVGWLVGVYEVGVAVSNGHTAILKKTI